MITVYPRKHGKPFLYTALPAIFMVIMTGWSMALYTIDCNRTHNWLLLIVNAIIVIFVLWMIAETIRILPGTRRPD